MINNYPKSWSEVSISKYIQIYNLKDEQDPIDAYLKTIAIILDISYGELLNLPLTEFEQIKIDLEFINQQPSQNKLKETIEIDGITYHQFTDFKNVSLGMFVDLESYIGEENFINNLHKIASRLYRKENTITYNVSECNRTADIFFEKMDIETCLSVILFFYLVALDYIPSHTKTYSMLDQAMMGMKMMKKELKDQNQ